MIALYAVTTFLGAALTFLLQPLVAKQVLPLFGGAPSVWNTCVLFFQAGLLAGYGYAHAVASSTRLRSQILVHLCLMAAALAVLPIGIAGEWAPGVGDTPVLRQLWLLLATAGLPFFVVAATTPMAQRWFSVTGHGGARDPYFLYAASNLGSLIALLAFPLVLEAAFDLSRLSRLWTLGYVALLVLIAGCAAVARRSAPSQEPRPGDERSEALPTRVRLRWIALAFVPSSLMLSVTSHLSQDIAAVPLLWVVPLALYLATYILAFSRRRLFSVARIERVLPLVAILLAMSLLAEGLELPAWASFPLHLGGFVWIALACHGQLADLRPHVSRLTEYYVWLAVGGLAGGIFNALVAPALFSGAAEYPTGLVMACLLRRPPAGADENEPLGARDLLLKDVLPAGLLGLGAFALMRAAPALGLGGGRAAVGLTLGVPALAGYLLLARPVRFALALASLFVAGDLAAVSRSDVLFASRTYYGQHRVQREGDFHQLYHGQTLHGIQSTRAGASREPLAYYHRTGPAGSLFGALESRGRRPTRVGVVGLGVGSLAAYGRSGQRWTFYELDPTVVFLARESGTFTFWRDSRAELRAVIGDARVSLARETDARFDLLILDAFSSDAIPVHLLTREALELYRRRLAPGGTLAFHISNRFLDLETVLGSLAGAAGMQAVGWADLVLSSAQRDAGKLPSHWVVLSTAPGLMRLLSASGGWKPLAGGPDGPVWTDRFSNVLAVLRWREAALE